MHLLSNDIFLRGNSNYRFSIISNLFIVDHTLIHFSGKPTEAVKVLEKLTHNAVAERRFDDASYYFWKLSMAYLKLANQAQTRGSIFAHPYHQ